MIERSKEWWMSKAAAEEGGEAVVSAGAMPDPIAEERGRLMRQIADKIEELEAALREIAQQKLINEMSVNHVVNADFEGAYDMMINRARSALKL